MDNKSYEIEELRTSLYQLLDYTLTLRKLAKAHGVQLNQLDDAGVFNAAYQYLTKRQLQLKATPLPNKDKDHFDYLFEVDAEIKQFFQAGFNQSS